MAEPSGPVVTSATECPSAPFTRNTVPSMGAPLSASRFQMVRLGRLSFSSTMVPSLPGKQFHMVFLGVQDVVGQSICFPQGIDPRL